METPEEALAVLREEETRAVVGHNLHQQAEGLLLRQLKKRSGKVS